MAEKNLTENLIPTADYISHHLTNLTYGWCEKSQSWGFAYHQQNIFKETSCKVSEMGFWSFHLDTFFMSTFLGLIFFGFFGKYSCFVTTIWCVNKNKKNFPKTCLKAGWIVFFSFCFFRRFFWGRSFCRFYDSPSSKCAGILLKFLKFPQILSRKKRVYFQYLLLFIYTIICAHSSSKRKDVRN